MEGHRQRMKHRFIADGGEGFADHEFVELMLFYTVTRKDTNPIGHRVIDRYGTLHAALRADKEELSTIAGVGERGALFLKLIPEIGRRYIREKWAEKTTISTRSEAKAFVMALYRDVPEATNHLLALNNQQQLIAVIPFTWTTLDVRRLAQSAFSVHAASVILACDHRGEVNNPFEVNEAAVGLIAGALTDMNVRVQDYLVLTKSEAGVAVDTFSAKE